MCSSRCSSASLSAPRRGDEYLETDTVFGVKDSLVKDFVPQDAGTPTPDGREIDGTWTKAQFDIVLAPQDAK